MCCEQALTLLTVFNHTRPRHYYRGLKYRRWRCRKCYLHRDDAVVGADVLDVGLGIIVGKLVHVLVAINTYVDELYRKPIQLNLVISKSRGPVRNVRYTCTIRLTSLLLVYYPRDPCPVSLCVRLNVSVRSRCSIQRDGRIDLVFGTEASFDQSYIVIRKFRYLEK